MKKILFSTMIACLLAFVGCQNEELVNETTNNGGEKVILTANIQGATDSRVVLTPDTENGDPIVRVAWNESGETFEVYGSSGASSTFTQIAGTNQFEGTLPESADGKYEAYYGDLNSLDEQDGKLGQSTANDTPVLMSAMFDSSSPSITFEHVTAILKPTFMVDDTDIDNSITKIVMGDVAFPLNGTPEYRKITIAPTSPAITLADVIYIHLPIMIEYNTGDTFHFTVTADGKEYTGSLTIPTGMSIVAGKLYTATIALTEVNACYLPIGKDFKNAVNTFLTSNASLTQIKFIADPTWTPQGIQIEESGAYMVANGTTLEIRTDAEVFMFNEKSSSMFSGSNNNIGSRITSIDFNDCINTSNVTTLAYMFQNCSKLTSLNLSGFNTANVTSLKLMFDNCAALQNITFGNSFSTNKVTAMDYVFRYCLKLTSLDLTGFSFNDNPTTQEMFYYTGGSNATENRIPIKVTETGYNFLKDKIDTNIQYSNAKYVQPDGADWPASE